MRTSNRVLTSAALCALTGVWAQTHPDTFEGHPRALIISDIGNEPDDQMSLVRLLLYSNQIDIEALVASTSTWQKTAVHPETMRMLIRSYSQVREHLFLHDKGWPAARMRVRCGSRFGAKPIRLAQALMTWTVADYRHVNHNPIAIVNGTGSAEESEMRPEISAV